MRILPRLLLLVVCAVSAAFAQPQPFRPLRDRLPEKPAWELDVTDALTLAATGASHADTMSADARNARVKNGALRWTTKLALPADAQPGWPVVLEADESRVIQSATLDGKDALAFNRDHGGNFLASGEGVALLPLGADRPQAVLELTALENPAVYANGFGRLRLRPATLDEVLAVERDNPASIRVRLVNRGAFPLTGTLRIRHEDYFAAPLGSGEQAFTLAPFASADFDLTATPAADAALLYKTRLTAEVGGRKSFEYWRLVDAGRDRRERRETLRLAGPWEWAFVPGSFEKNPPPADGWKKAARLPIVPKGADYTSHWMWARTRFKIPADWPAGRQARIYLGNDIHHHARIVFQGRVVGEAANWELPRSFALPAGLAPGSEHELFIGITDYIVGLAPGIKPPAQGAMELPARGIAAPMGPISHTRDPLQLKLDTVPELLWVPAVRVEQTALKTTLAAGPAVTAAITVRGETARTVRVASKVYFAGEPVLDLGAQSIDLPRNGTGRVVFNQAWPQPVLWSPDTPDLLELRTVVSDANGQVLDLHRERFGFREFGTEGSRFTLNGDPIHLLGGSHADVTQSWPVRSHPFRFIRHGVNGSAGFIAGCVNGVVGMDAADELGYLLKSENRNVCSYVADVYAWHVPETWTRFESFWRQAIDAYRNHPSIVMWDVGNEISFKGEGEAARMGQLHTFIESYDGGTRIATVGGSYPFPVPAPVLNVHGWGEWENRTDYFFQHPEERPSYLKTSGYYARRPADEPAEQWKAELTSPGSARQLYPGNIRELRHVDGRPVIFAEGHYYESQLPTPLLGHDAYLGLPVTTGMPNWMRWNAWHHLNILTTRTLSIQNVRQAGTAASIIHVDRGLGRAMLPLAAFSWDRRVRFVAGTRLQTRFGVHYDLTHPGNATATFRLYDGDKLLGEKTDTRSYRPAERGFVDLDFALPADTAGRTLRIEVRVANEGGGGEFYDHVPVTVYAPTKLALPAGQQLAVFDPRGAVADALRADGVKFTALTALADWTASPTTTLLVGTEGLAGVAPADLVTLRKKIAAGGRAIVLDHFTLPSFLSARLAQSSVVNNYVAKLDGPSPITTGLTSEDFRAWTTREKDQAVSWNPLEQPGPGPFRAHLTVGRAAPVLEVGEGSGRVLFVQLNFRDALGLEPAATRVLANVLAWTGAPSPFAAKPALIVSAPGAFASGLLNRVGLDAQVNAQPTAADLAKAGLIVLAGDQPAARTALDAVAKPLRARLDAGASLLVYGLDEAGAAWLSRLTGREVKVEAFAHRFATVLDAASSVTRGLGHGDFFVSGLGDGFDPNVALTDDGQRTGVAVVAGKDVRALTKPAYLGELPVGKGRVVVCQVRALELPVPSQLRVLSQVLLNLGAHLDLESRAKTEEKWVSSPIDLKAFTNRSTVDSDTPGEPRGWNASGADNDLRELPTGRQTFKGITYDIAVDARGGRFIALTGAKSKLGDLPAEVKGIPVDRKAERLYFLHVSVWGVPGFVYRVYYKEDRAKWIPGLPDPFIDVVVKPGEHIDDWVFAGATERGERFLPGATVAWVGGNKTIRRTSTSGGKDVGLFQMAWDNPHPEKTIESIDILSPGEVGGGHPFVFAITAANRDLASAPKAAPAPPLAKVLPADIAPSEVQAQVQFPGYGFVVLKNGSIAALYNAEGRALISSGGYRVEASRARVAQAPELQMLGRQSDTVGVTVAEQSAPDRREFVFAGEDAALSWKQNITATPVRLRVEFAYTPKLAGPEGFVTRVLSGVRFHPGSEAEVKINQNPITLNTPDGPAIINFDTRHTTWVFSYRLQKDSLTLISPAKHHPDYEVGRAESFWWEISLP